LETDGGGGIVFATKEGFGGDVGGFFEAEEEGVAGLGSQFLGEGRGDGSLAGGEWERGELMEAPEAGVDAVDLESGGAFTGGLVGEQPFEGDERGGVAPSGSQFLAKQGGGGDDLIGVADTFEGKAAERGADAFAHKEGAAEDSDGGGNAEEHGEVGTPMIGEIAADEGGKSHRGSSRPSTNSNWRGARAASFSLWVTRTSIMG
jgi:hypothetical protein